MVTFFHNIAELARALWDFFLVYPVYTLFWIFCAILAVLAVRRIIKLEDEAKGPIILR